MSTVELTLDTTLLTRVDEATHALGISRDEFFRKALEEALRRLAIAELEEKHRAGYERHPVQPNEFEDWETEQAWGEA
jgi:metal-responsive CopG/Arc/MetJ family transcriptional regulator